MKLDFLKLKDAEIKPIKICPEYNYKLDVDELGNEVVVVDSERDIQAEMNAEAKDCNIYNIILKHEAGDLTALNQKQGFYATEELVDAAEALVSGKSLDAKLYETYKQFDCKDLSFNEYVKMVINGQYAELYELKNKKNEEVSE